MLTIHAHTYKYVYVLILVLNFKYTHTHTYCITIEGKNKHSVFNGPELYTHLLSETITHVAESSRWIEEGTSFSNCFEFHNQFFCRPLLKARKGAFSTSRF